MKPPKFFLHVVVAALAVLPLWALTGKAAESRPIPVLLNEDHFPLSYRDDAGRPAGLYADILREASRRSGVPLQIRAASWARAMRALETGDAALAGTLSYARLGARWRVSQDLYHEVIVAVAPAETELKGGEIEGLRAYRTCFVEDWDYGALIEDTLSNALWKVDPAPSEALCLRKLEAGRVQVALVGEAGAARLVIPSGQHPMRAMRMGLELPAHVFWPPTVPDETVRRIDVALRHMADDGTLARLVQRHVMP